MRDALEPLLYQHGVDAVFAGAHCLTLRSKPLLASIHQLS